MTIPTLRGNLEMPTTLAVGLGHQAGSFSLRLSNLPG